MVRHRRCLDACLFRGQTSISHQGSNWAHTRGSGEQNDGGHKGGEKQFVPDTRSKGVNLVIQGAVVWQWQESNAHRNGHEALALE